jgi:ketosteroid isomerase-like protein
MIVRTVVTCLILAALGVAPGAQIDPQAIQRMVATERAFAAATAEIGVRDGFLTFFADDAVQIDHGADGRTSISRAKDALVRRPLPTLPLSGTLLWEPFTGQIADDGTMGWLAGAYAGLDQTGRTLTAHGAYFSVWKRQPDGEWRVWLDEGISLPDVWRDAAPFRAAPDPDAGTAGQPGVTLEAAEQAVSGGGAPWIDRLGRDVRLHRDGVMPIVGREAAVDWSRATWTSVSFTTVRIETSGSDDLGIALGGYRATTATGPEHGTWVRAWRRDVTGRWRIVFETNSRK